MWLEEKPKIDQDSNALQILAQLISKEILPHHLVLVENDPEASKHSTNFEGVRTGAMII